MKKVCFVIPHFGKLPNYFQLFLKTCSWNPDFNWLIFTDDNTNYFYPSNVKCVYMSFEELKSIISTKFPYQVALERPYKLCDFRPLYGYIFEKYLKEYTHWGHCDTDTIMGNLGKFITDEMLNEYDKIFQLGHLSIYKNTSEINMMAMQMYKERNVCKEILQNPRNCWYDEEWDPQNNISINKILIEYEKKIYKKDLSLNISFNYNRFVRIVFTGIFSKESPFGFEIEKKKKAIYVWEKGNLYRMYIHNAELIKEEYPYAHFQKRPMLLWEEILNQDIFEIIPDEFRQYRYGDVDFVNFDNIHIPCKSFLVQKIFVKRVVSFLRNKIIK